MTIAQPCTDEPYAHLVDPDHYEAHGYPHESWRALRAERPIHYVERAEGDSFWAITKLDDITAIGRQPELFSSQTPVVRDQEMIDHPAVLPSIQPHDGA